MTVLPVVDGTHSHELVFTVYLFNSPDKPSQNVENLFDLGLVAEKIEHMKGMVFTKMTDISSTWLRSSYTKTTPFDSMIFSAAHHESGLGDVEIIFSVLFETPSLSM